ncbi:MAG: tRNA (adenosine(37)-N6)-threonylcarbamoyltransferase complex dimerization subunit type 1 TsaB [Firmicutes bacterium]|nr:tRNA (adenosine(37)-N6)-threonylcarbamoyltransferase complex dimerization subunit type 1 TsaB [Candidatus Fermentithermobacillaceae bacterium]
MMSECDFRTCPEKGRELSCRSSSPETPNSERRDTGTVLAIESSTVRAGVALMCGETVVVELTVEKPRIHSTWLLPAALEAMKLAEVGPGDILCLVVSEGPGSFTGLRIGFATAQGLAVAWSKPVVPVPSFLVLSTGISTAGWKGAVFLAAGLSKDSAITAVYLTDGRGGATEFLETRDRSLGRFLDEAVQRVPEFQGERGSPAKMLCLGDAAHAVLEEWERRREISGDDRAKQFILVLADPYLALPRPGVLARLGRALFLQGKAVPPERALPRYYRKSPARRGVTESRVWFNGGEWKHG